jgi:periplasmic divalent cation tolerance protein
MKRKVKLVLSTCPDPATAQRLGAALVEARLAACVSVVHGLTSIYRWQGAVEQEQECLLLLKTSDARVAALTEWLRSHHPYELPEIIAVPVTAGARNYLDWVIEQTEPSE